MIRDNSNDIERYDDIINLPHHRSKTRQPMPNIDRAAQFSPFAALTGYDGAIKETARLTDRRIELDEAAKTILDEKLRTMQEQIANKPEITITYFQPDEKKVGGAYVNASGFLKKIDIYERALILVDGLRIELDDIIDIDFCS